MSAVRAGRAAARTVLGLLALVWAVTYLAGAVRGEDLARVAGALGRDPVGLAAALAATPRRSGCGPGPGGGCCPALSAGQAWAALHVSLLGNHVLPLRLGEALRVDQRAAAHRAAGAPVTASAVSLRGADLLAVLGSRCWPRRRCCVDAAGAGSASRRRRSRSGGAGARRGVVRPRTRARVRLPGAAVGAAAVVAWVLEAAVVGRSPASPG